MYTHTHTHTHTPRTLVKRTMGHAKSTSRGSDETRCSAVVVVLREDGSSSTDMRLLIDVRRRVRMQMTKLNIAIMCTHGDVFLYYKLCRRSANNTHTYIHRNTLMYTQVDRLGTSPISGGRLKLCDCRTCIHCVFY